MKEINVVITMDCEPITSGTHASATGPNTAELGQRATTGYARIAGSLGFPITFFIHPEMALAQADIFLKLENEGACLGLHMHPWKYSMSRHAGKKYLEHYGGLTESEQRELLSEASALWREAMGYRPVYFRPGTFSGNDSVFKVLAELGFRGGSCSLPGRMMPEFRAVWVGTVPDPHRGHEKFRHLHGALDFAEMPLSTDFSIALNGKIGGKLHPDLRPDIDWADLYDLSYTTIAQNIVDQVIERAPEVPVINLVSHNHFDFSDPAHPATQRIALALEAINAGCKARGVQAVGATIKDITDKVLSLPVKTEGLVCEGSVYGRPGKVATLATNPA